MLQWEILTNESSEALMSWLCKCGLINTGLNYTCAAKQQTWFEHYQISSNTSDFLTSVIAGKELGLMTPQEELFAKFYNQEKILVKDMDTVQLREHREQLSQIAFEAKARLVAADDEGRDRNAKTKGKEWLVTVDSTVVSSDAINAVKQRAARMSKMDKLRMQLLTAGIDEDTVKEMVANMERKATEKNLKTVTFEKQTTEIAVVTVKTSKPEINGNKEPFDPSTLVFSNK